MQYVVIHHAVLAHGVRPPYPVQDLLAGDHAAAVAGQEIEEIEFFPGEHDLLTAPLHASSRRIKNRVPDLDGPGPGRTRAGAGPGYAP